MRPYITSHRRRGTVTVIVVAFLSLMLVLGLSFAYYSLREAEESRIYRDSARGGQTGVVPVLRTPSGIDDPPEPDMIVNKVYGDVIYGPSDDLAGAFNVLRGHELARSSYGWNPKYPSPYWPFNIPPTPGTFDPNKAAIHPFNGYGYVSPDKIGATIGAGIPLPANMINFAWVPSMSPLIFDIDNNYARDPRLGAPQAWDYTVTPPVPAYRPQALGGPPGDRYWAKNADYSYPDNNNFFLGAIDPTSGKVLIQSYHRPWLIVNATTGAQQPPPPNPEAETPPRTGPTAVPPTFIPGDPNPWTNVAGRLQMLRPRPVDHQWPPGSGQSEWRYPMPNFVGGAPDGTYGDVELLTGKSIGRYYDAQWLDPDLPVRTWRGKNYKPLIAMLIVDLDGRINLNTAGNYFLDNTRIPPQMVHASNQGVGPWEVNVSRVLLTYPPPTVPQPIPVPFARPDEGAQLLLGTSPTAQGRYGISWMNTSTGLVPLIAPIKQYVGNQPNPAVRSTIATPDQVQMVGQNQPPSGSAAHFYGAVDYKAGFGQGGYSIDDVQGHATNFTYGWGQWGQAYIGQWPPLTPAQIPQPHPNNRYGQGIYIADPTNPDAPPIYDERSDHPSLFNPYLVRNRTWMNKNPGLPVLGQTRIIPNRVFGVEDVRNLNAQYNYAVSQNSQLVLMAKSLNAMGALGNPEFFNGQLNARFVTTPFSNDIDLPGSGPFRISLNATPPQQGQPYPPPTGQAGPVDPTNPALPTDSFDDSFRTRMNSILGPVDLSRKLTDYRMNLNAPLGPGNIGNWQRAIADRQQLAADIFKRLRYATGESTDPAALQTPTAGNPTQRWLAQVAVNIVDFIDSDECITPFKWTSPTGGDQNGLPMSNEPTNQLDQYAGQIKNDWVFGFERPRVNVNEGYFRIDNDPNDPFPVDMTSGMKTASLDYDMKLWLELHNPLTPASAGEQFMGSEGYGNPAMDDNTHGGYRAALKDNFTGQEKTVYRVLVYRVNGQAGAVPPDSLKMRGYDNVAGIPDVANSGGSIQFLSAVRFDGQGVNPDNVDTTGNSKGLQVIEPNGGAQYRDESFFLAGPQLDQQMGAGRAQIPTPNPDAQANLTTKALQAKVKLKTEFVNGQMQWSPSFVLQRLACPALPPSQMNPYITVDYFEGDPVAVNNHLKYDDKGPTDANNPGTEPDWQTTFSWGRRQPYDGVIVYTDQAHYRQTTGAPQMGKINHTLGQHNGKVQMPAPQGAQWDAGQTLEIPFRPLAHFDRVVLSPTELFQVVGTKPHELTHEFCGPPPPADPNNGLTQNGRLKYLVNWLDQPQVPTPAPAQPPQPGVPYQGGLMYRALGLLRTPTPLNGLGMGGRVPGKININTIFNKEVFNAICDAQAGGPNRFQQSGAGWNVDFAWNQLLAVRQRPPAAPGLMQIGQNDTPFRGFVSDTMFDRHRTLALPDMLWPQGDTTLSKEDYRPGQAPAGHASALEKFELLSKVNNQFTTRSNSFAVYMMIGYFEVRNPGPWNETNRPVLGKELGVDDGTITRHKYFAVIDRTNLSIEPNPPVAPNPNVSLPPIKQGQPPVYFSYQPDTPVPNPANNLNSIGTEDPVPSSPPQPVRVRVPAIGQAMFYDPAAGIYKPILVNGVPGVVNGQYDGIPWTIQAGVSQIVVDVGDRQETAIVQSAIYDPFTNSAVLDLAQPQPAGTPTPWPPIIGLHSRGATMRLANPDPAQPPSTPGNPGPQPGFNYKAARYAPVIKYVEQLK